MATIDILMATYNGERFVREQIESIQAQTFTDWRLLVSDDCSTDGTLDIVREMSETDSRIEIVSEGVRHGSAKANFMYLLSLSEAPYVMFCDQDDVWLPEKIEATNEFMVGLESEASNVPNLVFTDMKVVDSRLKVIEKSFMRLSSIDPARTAFPQVIAQSLGAGCTMMINSVARAMSLNVDSVTCKAMIMHDWWLSLIASAFGNIGFLDSCTSLYRQHESNEVGALRYSPTRRALHVDQMKESVAATVCQARAFLSCYGNMLSEKQSRIIDEFIASGEGSGISAVVHLMKSGCWKKGMRKLGQIAVCFR